MSKTINLNIPRTAAEREIAQASDLVAWLRGLATTGGKGTVNHIDARALGRVADELERLQALVPVYLGGTRT